MGFCEDRRVPAPTNGRRRSSSDSPHGAATSQPFYAVEVRKPLTVNVDEHVLEALQRAAANDGVQEDELVHEALRRYLGLRGLAVLDDIARKQAERGVQLDEGEAMALAVSEVRAARAERRRARGA